MTRLKIISELLTTYAASVYLIRNRGPGAMSTPILRSQRKASCQAQPEDLLVSRTTELAGIKRYTTPCWQCEYNVFFKTCGNPRSYWTSYLLQRKRYTNKGYLLPQAKSLHICARHEWPWLASL